MSLFYIFINNTPMVATLQTTASVRERELSGLSSLLFLRGKAHVHGLFNVFLSLLLPSASG